MDPCTCLIVDKDPEVRDMLTLWLSSEGHFILAADNYADGLRIALQTDPDVILLSACMSGMPITEFLRGLDKAARTPLILLTSKQTMHNLSKTRSNPNYKPEFTRQLSVRIQHMCVA